MSEHMSPIPSRVYNAAVGGHVCGPEDVDFGQKVVHLIKYDRAGNEVSFESQVTQANKIYVIHDDFTLSSNVTIPANCVLEFDGGSISGNYTITFTDTKIVANKEVFDISGVAGTIANKEVYLSWWKLAYNNNTNDAILINQIIAAVDNCVFYYDIQNNIYVGGYVSEVAPNPSVVNVDYAINVVNKNNIEIKQTTPFFTILKGTSRGGEVFRIAGNTQVKVSGVRIDGNNIHVFTTGENGFGVVGKEDGGDSFVDISDCVIKNCQKGFDGIAVYGDIYNGGTYPEWGSGGKGIQIEGGIIRAFVHNCSIFNSYIGVSHVQHSGSGYDMSHNAISYDHITIDGCNIAIVCLKLGTDALISYTNFEINDCSGENGLICMGNAYRVFMNGISVKGSATAGSLLRGSYSSCMMNILCTQKCTRLIDIALFRDNPEGDAKAFSIVNIRVGACDYIIGNSGLEYPKLPGGETNGKLQGGQYNIDVTTAGSTVEGVGQNFLWTTPLFKFTMNDNYYEGGFNKLLSTWNKTPINISNWGNSRPSNPPAGFMYFDITLSPKRPIWYYEGNWVDATGATV